MACHLITISHITILTEKIKLIKQKKNKQTNHADLQLVKLQCNMRVYTAIKFHFNNVEMK